MSAATTSPEALFDVIVVGVGSFGSAIAYQLAKRGKKVLGIERYQVAHDRGSTHGESRIIRMAYFEDPRYVPMLRRAYHLWRELEKEAGEKLLHITGGIDAGPADCTLVQGALASCTEHKLEHEVLTGEQLNERFPGFNLPKHFTAVYQPDAGILIPEACTAAHARLAQKHNAELRTGEVVLDFKTDSEGIVTVATDKGSYRGKKIVLSAGAWMGEMLRKVPALSHIDKLLKVERQVVTWYRPTKPELYRPGRFPIFLLDESNSTHFYGFPIFGGREGVKVARYNHRFEVVTKPEELKRDCDEQDEAASRGFVSQFLPHAHTPGEPAMHQAACMFTNTPDEHFIIDSLPEAPQFVVISACSGHGYKFSSVIGEIGADLAMFGKAAPSSALPEHSFVPTIDWLGAGRFKKQANEEEKATAN